MTETACISASAGLRLGMIIGRLTILLAHRCAVVRSRTARALSSEEVDEQAQVWWSLTRPLGSRTGWGMWGFPYSAEPTFSTTRASISFASALTSWIWKSSPRRWATRTCGRRLPGGRDTWPDEERIYEQVQVASKIGSVSMLNRLRNEQRGQEKSRLGSPRLFFSTRLLVPVPVPRGRRERIRPEQILSVASNRG